MTGKMKIEELYTYPIKSLRGIRLDSSTVTKHGFPYDRRFMLLKVTETNGQKTYQNMHVSSFYEMVLFHPQLHVPPESDSHNTPEGTISVTFKPPVGDPQTLNDIPTHPDVDALARIDVNMHASPTKACAMPAHYSAWFSACFGFDVVLAYIGPYTRAVRMSTPGNPDPHATSPTQNQQPKPGWLSTLTSTASSLLPTSTTTTSTIDPFTPNPPTLTFTDCAPYLLCTLPSIAQITLNLPPDQQPWDHTKLRPNIVVSDPSTPAWDEDYWRRLRIGGHVVLDLPHNCVRCQSLNVDYATARRGEGKVGEVLGDLGRGRRVDVGARWSPVCGRYGFLVGTGEGGDGGSSGEGDGKVISVGDEVVVEQRVEEQSVFDWKGLSTLPGLKKGDR